MNSQDAFAQTRLINALLSYQQAPAYPRISWCGLGSPSITGFPSILKAEFLDTNTLHNKNFLSGIEIMLGKFVHLRSVPKLTPFALMLDPLYIIFVIRMFNSTPKSEVFRNSRSLLKKQSATTVRRPGRPCKGRVIMEYLVKDSKRRAFWSLNEDILKITIFKTNTPYPSRKIQRIRACTHQRPQRNEAQYTVSIRCQYAVLKI
ncbi:hypothetical protein Tco_0309488 [Tanacetum coccineum]